MTKIVRIDGMEVDIDSLLSISHKCAPGLCKKSECCCAQYDICIDDEELNRLITYMPDAAKLAPELLSGSGYGNVFEETEDNLYEIDTDDNDLCVFAYSDAKNNVLCSLHTVAYQFSLSPHEVKPSSCITWPLAVSEGRPMLLSVSDDAFDFPCNSRKGTKSLDPDIAQIIKAVFGEIFLIKVEAALAKREYVL